MDIKYSATILIVYILIITIYAIYLYRKNAFQMNAEPLTHQDLFWAAMIVPFSAFIVVGSICWYGKGLKIDSDGFNNFLSISKFPLALLSLSLPFGVVVNNVHRTIQTDKQIKEAERKNKADGFYSHRKNTIDMLDNLPLREFEVADGLHKLSFENSYTLYKTCFPSASTTSNIFVANTQFIDSVKVAWISLNNSLENTRMTIATDFFQRIETIERLLKEIHTLLKFTPIENSQLYFTETFDGEGNFLTLKSKFNDEDNIREAILAYWKAYLTIGDALEIAQDDNFMSQVDNIERYVQGSYEIFGGWNSITRRNAMAEGLSIDRVR